MFSLVRSLVKSRSLQKENKVGITRRSRLSERDLFLLLVSFKNAVPLFKTIGILFFISFVSLVLKEMNIIGSDIEYPVVVPIISCIIFFTLPILNTKVIGDLEKNRKKLVSVKLRAFNWIIIFLYTLIYVGALFALPIWSLILLKSIYVTDTSVILPVLLVIFLQVVTVITFMNYFSAMSVKREMTFALSKLSDIQQRIDDAILNETTNKSVYSPIKESYLESKLFNLSADDSLLINFYSLFPNPIYLSRLSKKPIIDFPRRISRRLIFRIIKKKIKKYLSNRHNNKHTTIYEPPYIKIK